MRTTVTIDDKLLADAKRYTGIEETSGLVEHALTLVVRREAAEQLIRLGGTMPDIKAVPRRRWSEDGTSWEGNPD